MSIFSDLEISEDQEDNIIFSLLFSYGQFSSLACTALLNLDRAVAVIYPFRYKCWRTKRSVSSALLLSWVSSIVMQLVYFFTRCGSRLFGNYCFRIILSIAILAVVFFMVAANLNVFYTFRKRSKIFANTNASASLSRKLIERRVLFVAFLSTNCVMFFTVPYAVLTLLRCIKIDMSYQVHLAIYMVFIFKSVANPVIFFAGRYFIRAHHNTVQRRLSSWILRFQLVDMTALWHSWAVISCRSQVALQPCTLQGKYNCPRNCLFLIFFFLWNCINLFIKDGTCCLFYRCRCRTVPVFFCCIFFRCDY